MDYPERPRGRRLSPCPPPCSGRSVPAISYPDDGHQRCRQVEEGSFWFAHRNLCLLALLRRFPPRGAVYDVGGGNGFVAKAMQDAGHEVVLVEPGSDGVANARARGVAGVFAGTLDELDPTPGSLAAVGLFDVVEHVEADVAFLASVRRALGPDGWLYLSVPCSSLLWSNADVRAGHFRRYSARSLRRTLREAGLEPVLVSHIFSALPLPVLVGRSLPSGFGRFGASAQAKPREHGLGGGPGRARPVARQDAAMRVAVVATRPPGRHRSSSSASARVAVVATRPPRQRPQDGPDKATPKVAAKEGGSSADEGGSSARPEMRMEDATRRLRVVPSEEGGAPAKGCTKTNLKDGVTCAAGKTCKVGVCQ